MSGAMPRSPRKSAKRVVPCSRASRRIRNVHRLHVGYMDTDMADYVDESDKVDPAWVAGLALDGIESRALEVVADDKSRNVRAALSSGLELLYPGFPVAS